MIIDISKLLITRNKKDSFNCSIEADSITIKHNSFPIKNNKPFELSIVNEENKRLNLSLATTVVVTVPCDRCLTDCDITFDISIDKTIDIKDGRLVSVDDDISFIEDDEILVDNLLFDEILVDWPSKVLCKEDCKGICPKCGTNLNISSCDCDLREIDPRMARFQDVFEEFKEV